jgi:hypothetical protein
MTTQPKDLLPLMHQAMDMLVKSLIRDCLGIAPVKHHQTGEFGMMLCVDLNKLPTKTAITIRGMLGMPDDVDAVPVGLLWSPGTRHHLERDTWAPLSAEETAEIHHAAGVVDCETGADETGHHPSCPGHPKNQPAEPRPGRWDAHGRPSTN